MATYSTRLGYPAPLPLYYAFPVVWCSSSSQAQSLSSTYSVASTPRARDKFSIPAEEAQFPSKRSHRSPSGTLRSLGFPPTPQLRNIPLPDVSNTYGEGHERVPYPYVLPQRPLESHTPHSLTAHPSVDPCLALPHHPNARLQIVWDLMRHPSTALFQHSPLTHDQLRRRVAVRASRREGGQPLQSLILVFPLLQTEIVISPSHRTPSQAASGYISVWDVLEGLYRGLRAPIEPQELRKLTQSERETLLAMAEARREVVAEVESSGRTLRKIDYLARRRWFLGMRPALGYELPRGRKLGEVFVIEVGTAG